MFSLFCLLFISLLTPGIHAANCGEIDSINGGNISYIQIDLNNLFETGSTALLVCQPGRIPNGNIISTCGYDGTWTPSLGTCSSFSGNEACSEISVPNGTVTYIQASDESPYQPGTKALLSCNLGFLPTGATTSTCDDGIWSPPLDSCKSAYLSNIESSITCSTLPPVANGQIVYLQSSLFITHGTGTVALLVCDLGYHPNDKAVSKCTDEGTWEPLGACVRIGSSTEEAECPEFDPVENGQISYNLINPRQSGTLATLLCNIGYLPSGPTVAICEDHGKWSDTLGTCVSILDANSADINSDCPALSVENGVVSYDLFQPKARGTTATLFCNAGYILNGNMLSTCKDDGTWTPSIGVCKTLDQVASDTLPECPSIDLENGFVFYDLFKPRKSGTAARLVCDFGYLPEGATLVICNPDGSWNDSLGSCRSIFGK